jgi:hypothetical protein
VFALQSYGKTSATVSPSWAVSEANVRAQRALLAEPCASPAAEPWHYVVSPNFLPTTYVPIWDRLPIQPTELPPFQSGLDRCLYRSFTGPTAMPPLVRDARAHGSCAAFPAATALHALSVRLIRRTLLHCAPDARGQSPAGLYASRYYLWLRWRSPYSTPSPGCSMMNVKRNNGGLT